MKIVVQKFGGTSVSTEENRKKVIEKVKNAVNEGYSPVVVVSAMGRKGEPYATDSLLSLIDDKFKNVNKLAQDLLMCCGEIISSVVMSNDLYSAGIDAVPLTGGQAGILTDSNFTDSTCINVTPKKILDLVSQGRIPVITGFQGITENGYLTTLGRGGSDTTASILGVALKASAIEIYTDVDGIMTADPRIVKNANLIDVISYNEVFQLADKGATVIHPKAVEIAMEGNIPILIKNTLSNCKGTLINNFGDKVSDKLMTGITSQKNRIQVSIRACENEGNVKYKNVLDLVAANNISLDLINIFPKEQIFTITQKDKEVLVDVLNDANLKYSLIEDCSKVAVIGSKMKGIPGVMAKIIKALSDSNIEVLQTADSHMTIWCLVRSKNEKDAINVLHKTFKL
ncbi:aspartate kinase [Clostridium sp.]|uniref:aspartate kinase n=1 Tax=Clostridium sp. TaxID=1506 RepID=UPI00284C86B4|nr:aspartate kinase [Clostridium sp.]MDR3594198.1 aspartate kinase [Clostridium sp.]